MFMESLESRRMLTVEWEVDIRTFAAVYDYGGIQARYVAYNSEPATRWIDGTNFDGIPITRHFKASVAHRYYSYPDDPVLYGDAELSVTIRPSKKLLSSGETEYSIDASGSFSASVQGAEQQGFLEVRAGA